MSGVKKIKMKGQKGYRVVYIKGDITRAQLDAFRAQWYSQFSENGLVKALRHYESIKEKINT